MSLIDYIDTEKTTIAILRDWNDQNWKFDFNKDKIEEITSRLTSMASRTDKVLVSGGSNDTDGKYAAVIDKKTVLEHGFKLASEYRNELMPCWQRLTDDEQFMLVCRFIDKDEGRGVETIMARYFISKTEAYNRSNEALRRLAKLIFW